MNTRQFKDKPLGLSADFFRDNFHIADGPTSPDLPVASHSPVSIPPQWFPPEKKLPSIPYMVGFVIITLCTTYALFEAGCLLCEAFLRAIK